MKKIKLKVTVWIPKGWKKATVKRRVNELLKKHFGQSTNSEEVE